MPKKVEQGTELSRLLLLLAFSVYHLMSQFSPPFDSKQVNSPSSSATPLGDQLFKTGLFIWHAGVLLTLGSSLNACCSLLFIDTAVPQGRVAIKDGSISLLSQFILPNQVSN
jgi:hypothetical protein